jgi:hypothetical protein
MLVDHLTSSDQERSQAQEGNGRYIKNEHHGMISPSIAQIIYLENEFGTPEATSSTASKFIDCDFSAPGGGSDYPPC